MDIEALLAGVPTPSAEDMESRRGLARHYTLVFLRKGPAPRTDEALNERLQLEHLQHLTKLQLLGKLVLNGPTLVEHDIVGVSMYATELEEARALAEADPKVKAGYLTVEAIPWLAVPGDSQPLTNQSILWRGFYLPGYDACRLSSLNSRWHLTGTAVFSHEQRPCRLDYLVVCDSGWQTLSGKVAGWLGNTTIDIQLTADPDRHWWLNGVERPEVAGYIDLDLNFSPSTNLLPIRRLGLAVGQAAEVKAAWLRFPSFELEPLLQIYRRIDESNYRYESAGGQFVADLQVNSAGFVTNYPGIWRAEAVI